MSWSDRISVVLLIVLTVLPGARMACAIECAAAETVSATAHHGAGKTCDEDLTPVSGPRLGGQSLHDCRHHETVRSAATTVATRADSVPGPGLLAAAVHETVRSLAYSRAAFGSRTPGRTRLTRFPLILRV